MVRVQGSVQRWGVAGPLPVRVWLSAWGVWWGLEPEWWLGPGFTGTQAVMLGQFLASPGLGFPSGSWGGRQVAVPWGDHEN